MGEVRMVSTGLCEVAVPPQVGGVDYNPHLKATGICEVGRAKPPGWPEAYLSDGPATVSNVAAEALVGVAGKNAREIAIRVRIDGTTAHGLLGAVDFGEGPSDAYTTAMASFAMKHVSLLRHARASVGKSFVVDAIVKDAGGGVRREYNMFRGRIQSVEDQWRAKRCTIKAESIEAILDRTAVYLNLQLQGRSVGCVLAGYGDEFQTTAQNNDVSIIVGSGRAVLDTGSYGAGDTPPGDSIGGLNTGGANGGSSSTVVDFPSATTLVFASQPDLTLDDPQALGMKTIFVTPQGTLAAADGGGSPLGIPLWTWEHLYRGMPITQSALLRVMYITLEDGRRKVSQVIRYLLEKMNIDTTGLRFPTNGDEVLSEELQLAGPLAKILDDLAYLCRWKRSRDAEGNVIFEEDRIKRLGYGYPDWTYGPGTYSDFRITSPELNAMPTGGLVVLGNSVVNLGRQAWSETIVKQTFGPKPKKDNTGVRLAGEYRPGFDAWDKTVELKQVVFTTVWYQGSTEVKRRDTYRARHNPKNYKGLKANLNGADRRSGMNMGSPEAGLEYLLEEAAFDTMKDVIWTANISGPVLLGFDKVTRERENPKSMGKGAIGDDLSLPDPYFGGVGYGFLRDEEKLEVKTVERMRITPTSSGFVAELKTQFFAFGNPGVNYEAPGVEERPHGPPDARHSVGNYLAETDEIIMLLEEITTFRREDYEWTVITTDKREFRKKGSAHGGGIKFASNPAGMGHSETELIGRETERARKRQQPPSLESVQERIQVTPVGQTLLATSLQAECGDDNRIVLTPNFLCSYDQARRVAIYEWERRLAYGITISAPWNPALRKWQTVRFLHRLQPESRVIDVLGVVTGYRGRNQVHGAPSRMDFDIDVGRTDLSAFMAGRT